jgi:hypothetical protein
MRGCFSCDEVATYGSLGGLVLCLLALVTTAGASSATGFRFRGGRL